MPEPLLRLSAAWRRLTAWMGATLSALAMAGPAQACDVNHPVVFAGLDWDSNAFHTAVAQRILRDGMGCQVEVVPGTTLPLIQAMARGDIHVAMEIWSSNAPPAWTDGVAAGRLVELGVNFPDAVQGWFVPRALVQGPQAQAPGLKAVTDLARYKDLFRDPEEPSRGRFLNCVAGWQCELTNTKKLHAYGLAEAYTNVRPGSGAAFDAAILSALKRGQPVLFYYWGPTWLLGQVGGQVVQLAEPPYDDSAWKALMALKDPREARRATAYPVVEVRIGAGKAFADRAPKIRAFLQRYRTSGALVSEALAAMQSTKGTPDAAAASFLRRHPAVWQRWVEPDVARRVSAALR